MTEPILAIEKQRRRQQERLDGSKSPQERNRWGQFGTPPQLALDIARYAYTLWQPTARRCHLLEPAVGTGSFLSAFLATFPSRTIGRIVGVELDPQVADAARGLWSQSGAEIIEADFTRQEPHDRPFDIIMTNPPYVRHHHLPPEDKTRLRHLVARHLRIKTSGLMGLYGYFLLLSDRWLADDGFSLWLVPSEFMDVNYGLAVRQYLSERTTLIHIHRFSPSDVQFCDALVSSAVVVFRKRPPAPDHEASFSYGGSLRDPQHQQRVPIRTLKEARKWSRYPQASETPEARHELCLGDLFWIKRGLATG